MSDRKRDLIARAVIELGGARLSLEHSQSCRRSTGKR
jgi:hypothetical protein